MAKSASCAQLLSTGRPYWGMILFNEAHLSYKQHLFQQFLLVGVQIKSYCRCIKCFIFLGFQPSSMMLIPRAIPTLSLMASSISPHQKSTEKSRNILDAIAECYSKIKMEVLFPHTGRKKLWETNLWFPQANCPPTSVQSA